MVQVLLRSSAGVAQVAPSKDFCNNPDWTAPDVARIRALGSPNSPQTFVPTISQPYLNPLQQAHYATDLLPFPMQINPPGIPCTCLAVLMSISTLHSLPSSSAPSSVSPARPSQIKFFRPAQMALFAKIITHPPLSQVSVILPSRKEVSPQSWQTVFLHSRPRPSTSHTRH